MGSQLAHRWCAGAETSRCGQPRQSPCRNGIAVCHARPAAGWHLPFQKKPSFRRPPIDAQSICGCYLLRSQQDWERMDKVSIDGAASQTTASSFASTLLFEDSPRSLTPNRRLQVVDSNWHCRPARNLSQPDGFANKEKPRFIGSDLRPLTSPSFVLVDEDRGQIGVWQNSLLPFAK